jgi:hypothetical protein
MFRIRVTTMARASAIPLLLAGYSTLASENLSEAVLAPMPERPAPDYLQPTTDPTFGTTIIRITDPGAEILPGVTCRPDYCRHSYASAQAWNVDQTLLIIPKGCVGLCFLDGQSYEPLFQRRPAGVCQWHSTDPEQMVCVSGEEIYRWRVRDDESETVYAPEDYSELQFGPGKGNLSKDGRRLVVVANNMAGEPVAFAYDIDAREKSPDIKLSGLAGETSYCTISASGDYIFCFQKMPDKTNTAYVFSLDGEQVQNWTENHRPGHGDLTVDSDGSDVYVGISKSDPDKYQVIKRRLSDGVVTVLTPRGHAQHASVRNIRQPGWVFLSYGGSYEKAGRPKSAPFYLEIVALRIDGSGQIRRVAHTHSAEAGYLSAAHASPSPDGSQVIWASNWGQPDGPVAAYVARLSWDE